MCGDHRPRPGDRR